MTLRQPLLLALAVLAPLLMGMSRKPDFTISFHLQASKDDAPKSYFPVGQLVFKRAPEISQQDISAFYPFKTDDGGQGLVLKLDAHGKNQLDIMTQSATGAYLLVLVNAKPVDYMVLDKSVSDGLITIWQGVPNDVIKAMDKKYTRLKPGTLGPSSSQDIQMDPTTPKEKEDAMKSAQQLEAWRKAQEKSKDPKDHPAPFTMPKANSATPQAPGTPQAPTTNRIPVEGGSPPTGTPSTPAPEPTLPR